MTPTEAIKILEELPENKSIACQVVGQNSGAWSMEFEFIDVKHSDWMIQLRITHPNLIDLPMDCFQEDN